MMIFEMKMWLRSYGAGRIFYRWKIWTDNLFSRDRSWTFCSVHTYLWTAGRLHFRTVYSLVFRTEYLKARIVQPVKNSSGACRVNVACFFLNYWLSWTYCPCKHEAFNRLNWFEVLFLKKTNQFKARRGWELLLSWGINKIDSIVSDIFTPKLTFILQSSLKLYLLKIHFYFLTIELGKLKP